MARRDEGDERARRARSEFELPGGDRTDEIDLTGNPFHTEPEEPITPNEVREASQQLEEYRERQAARHEEEEKTRELRTGTGPLDTLAETERSVERERYSPRQPYFSSDFTDEPEALSVVKGLRRKSAFKGFAVGAATMMAILIGATLYKLVDIKGSFRKSKARIAKEEEEANARIRARLRARLRKEVNTGDFNRDGYEDVVIVYPNSHEVRLGQPDGSTRPATEAYQAQKEDLQARQKLEAEELKRMQREEREAQKERQYGAKEGLRTRQEEERESIDAHVEALRKSYDFRHAPDTD